MTACDDEDGSLQIEVDVDGKKKWLDAQDELLCPPGTHKAVNVGASAGTAVLATPPSLLINYFERPGDSASSVPRNDQPAQEVESIRDATRAMQLADSDGDGDEWCVVDDGQDEDIAEVDSTNDPSNQTEEAVVEDEATISDGSTSSDADSGCNATSYDPRVPSANTVAAPTLNQLLPTTTDVVQTSQVEAAISEEDAWRYELQIDQLIDARDTDNVWYVFTRSCVCFKWLVI